MRQKWVLSSIITISLLASFLTGTFPAHADSVTVDTTSDVADGITTSIAALIASPGADGVISLREAMLAANNDPGPDTINFGITGCPSGICVITPTVALPVLNTGETAIDGFSQTDASPPSGATSADIRIMIMGSLIPSNNGIIINSADNVIKGLSIDHFPWYGVAIFGAVATGNEVTGNHIGVSTSGSGGLGNTLGGVLISLGASDNTIGGDTSSDRNVISNNGVNGVDIINDNSTGNIISGNYIGLGSGGSIDLGNTLTGVFIGYGAHDNIIGGDSEDERNVISGNDVTGVGIHGENTRNNTVVGNYIGLTRLSAAAGNSQVGVDIYGGAHDNTIGGINPGEGNVISGNGHMGVRLLGNSDPALDTTGNTIIGNIIGTTSVSAMTVGNGEHGVLIKDEAHHNTVGGDTPAERNVISQNAADGVHIVGAGTDGNVVSGNYIGTSPDGTLDRGNTFVGVSITGGAEFNIIGGDIAGERNLISGNNNSGAAIGNFIEGAAHNNTISGNYIGTTPSGLLSLGNGQGVIIGYGSQDNLIGGDDAGERNLISGNGSSGVVIRETDTRRNVVSGNYIGVDASGSTALMNLQDGVWIMNGAQENTIGGGSTLERNIISANDDMGVTIEDTGTAYNHVSGNYIGLDASGSIDLGNTTGVLIQNGAQHNVIGGDESGEGNVISGNSTLGVYIYETGTDHNTVSSNIIGLDATGAVAVGNGSSGIWINSGSQYNIIGGDVPAERNIIADFSASGIAISGAATSFNNVTGNYIGTDITGLLDRGGHTGIYIEGSSGNHIGGGDIGEGNLISGNMIGVNLDSSDVTLNTVAGNLIGTDATGNAALANDLYGIAIQAGAHDNLIGGDQPGERNIIAGGGEEGIRIFGSGTDSNTVSGNYVGLAMNGSDLGFTYSGLLIFSGAQDNTIGGPDPGDRNVISGSTEYGVRISGSGTSGNTVTGNFIGANVGGDTGPGNDLGGVRVEIQAAGNQIGPDNIITSNSGDGIHIRGVGTIGNTITENSIFLNSALGIDLTNSGNTELAAPNITSASCSGPAIGTTCADCTIELFSDNGDEGRYYEGSIVANGSGNFSLPGAVAGPHLTATATDASGNTSEFSGTYDLGLTCNTPPTAAFTITPSSGDRCTVFDFDATTSSDTEDLTSALEVRWDWDNDGLYDTAWTTTKTDWHRFLTAATHTARLQVRDTGTLTDTTTDTVVVAGTSCQTFPDVPYSHWAWPYVEGIHAAGLTAGYPDGTYRPADFVNRAQMAVFLLKGIHGANYTPPTPDGSHPFSDIGGHWAESWIEQLYDEGITAGFPDNTYRPADNVNRAQMAVMLLVAKHGSGYTPPAANGSHPFTDISGHWAEAWIEQLYDEGITAGYPDGTYRPADNVNRAQMAVFLVATFDLETP